MLRRSDDQIECVRPLTSTCTRGHMHRPPHEVMHGTMGAMNSSAADRPGDARLDGALLDQWWDFADPAASAGRFRAALAELPVGSTAHAELRTQLARALALQRLEAQALAELDVVAAELDAAVAAAPDDAQVRARLELERGRVENSNGRSLKAIPHFLAAVEASRRADDGFLLVDAFHMLAIADGERSEEWTRAALSVTETTTDPRVRRWIGSLCNNFGWTLHDRGDFAGALTQFESARGAYYANGSAEQQRVADWAVGRALRSLERYDEALAIQQRLAAGESDGYVDEELAELLLALGRPVEARPHFARAAALLADDPWLDEPQRLARLRALGDEPGELR